MINPFGICFGAWWEGVYTPTGTMPPSRSGYKTPPTPPLLPIVLFGVSSLVMHAAASPGQRILLDDGWRFQLGDPTGNAVDLRYDVRPEVTDARDDKAADSRPEEAARLAEAARTVLKPWILPT